MREPRVRAEKPMCDVLGLSITRWLSINGEFYPDYVLKETNKVKLERVLQGYHNGAVPCSSTSQLVGICKVGVPDPENASLVIILFERYAPEVYSDQQLERVPEPALNRDARTLLDLRETRESTTKEERKDLVHIMIQEGGIDVVIKCIIWVKARLNYEPFFSIMDGLGQDIDRRFWIRQLEGSKDNCDIQENMEQMSTCVEIVQQVL